MTTPYNFDGECSLLFDGTRKDDLNRTVTFSVTDACDRPATFSVVLLHDGLRVEFVWNSCTALTAVKHMSGSNYLDVTFRSCTSTSLMRSRQDCVTIDVCHTPGWRNCARRSV